MTEEEADGFPASHRISFSHETGTFLNVSEALIQEWQQRFPAVDVRAELEKMAQWLVKNRKQYSNYQRFALDWIKRTNINKTPAKVGSTSLKPTFEKPNLFPGRAETTRRENGRLEQISVACLQGMLSNPQIVIRDSEGNALLIFDQDHFKGYAKMAVSFAKALIKKLDKEGSDG